MKISTKLHRALPVLIAATGLTACGGAGPTITADAATASVERSAHVRLAPFSLPDSAREQGVTSAYANTPTAGNDGQAIAVFLLEDGGVADDVRDQVREAVPEPSKLMVNDNLVVVYASAGRDRAAQVQKAVAEL